MTHDLVLRPTDPDDQKKANDLFNMIDKSIESLDVDPNLIVTTLISLIAYNYKDNGHTYASWRREMLGAIKFYKRYWDADPS